MTVREIAKLTNLSPATISRVLKNPELVKPHTRDLVMSVLPKSNIFIEEIHILVPDLRVSPVYDMIQFMIDYLYDEDIQLIIHSAKNSLEIEERVLDRINETSESKNSALLWLPISQDRSKDYNYPTIPTVVLFDNNYVPNFTTFININDSSFIENTCNILYKGGAQNTMIIIDYELSSPRGDALQQLYKQHTSRHCPHLKKTFFSSNHTSNWQNLYHTLLQKYPDEFPFDSVISPSTEVAYGLVTFLKYKKLRVPQDVSLITFGYDIGLELMHPPISMIYPDAQRIAEHAIFLITWLFSNSSLSSFLTLELQIYLSGSERKY